jgi:hypothetical protein
LATERRGSSKQNLQDYDIRKNIEKIWKDIKNDLSVFGSTLVEESETVIGRDFGCSQNHFVYKFSDRSPCLPMKTYDGLPLPYGSTLFQQPRLDGPN